MHILLVGLNHKTTPLEVRERLTFSKEELRDALPPLKKLVREGVILSTCNRTEVYTATENPTEDAKRICSFVSEYHGMMPESVSRYLYEHTNADAVRHLFRVSSGLDSMIVGESQILGQVRDALTLASETDSAQVSMVGLFHAAVRAGRKVREETDVGRNALSISYAGVKLAEQVVGNLRGLTVLLIGAGEAGMLVAKALQTAGVTDLLIANRTRSHGEELAQTLGGRTIPFDHIEATLGDVDIVIAATDSPESVVTKEMVAGAARHRPRAPLFLFDLAVPRDVDPQVTHLNGVRLFNIDDLSSIAEENLEGRKRAATAAEAIVESELSRFMTWWDALDAVPTIKLLRQQAEDIRARELARALLKLPNMSQDQVQIVEALTRSIVNKLLHEPTESLRQRSDKTQLQAARDLFRLWDESS